jgi:NhaP-type Na+/H+ or K+/H+ antiporter
VALALILVVRPLAGVIALTTWRRDEDRPGGLSNRERWATAFFGVRGVGSIYYLAFAAGHSDVLAQDWLWSTVAFTVVASVLVHGVLSRPLMRAVDRQNQPG